MLFKKGNKKNQTVVKILSIFVVSILFLIVLVLLSTRMTKALKPVSALPVIPDSLSELEEFLALNEKQINPKLGTEKTIIFPDAKRTKSKLALIYLHGFSASRGELSPVFEDVAKKWKLPIFFTRFKGHGLGPDDLGEAKFTDWLYDAAEAYLIGKKLGDEIVLTCMSTGCSLGLYLAYFYPEKIKALVMLSPNFEPADRRAFLALGPLGLLFTQIFIGDYREYQPINLQQKYFWTVRYRARVIPEMMTLVQGVKKLDLSQIKIPILTLYTPYDGVVSATEIENNVHRLGSKINQLVPLQETKHHVLAGNVFNPSLNDLVENRISQFLDLIL
jgi:esterase/lipase